MRNKLKILLTVYLPVTVFLLLLILDKPFPDLFPSLTGSEYGFVENAQALLLLVSFGLASSVLFQNQSRYLMPIKIWLAAGMASLIFVFLEEISYGQHYFNWNTPEYWQALNDQDETNLHNTSSWFDQKPRLLLEIGIIMGGIIVPLLRRFKPQFLPEKLQPILPDNALFVTALLAILPRLYERIIAILDLNDWHLFVRTSEVQELYFYYFALLYFLFLRMHLSLSFQSHTSQNKEL